MHPQGGVYSTSPQQVATSRCCKQPKNDNDNKSTIEERQLLQITGDFNEISTFDLDWLFCFCFDDSHQMAFSSLLSTSLTSSTLMSTSSSSSSCITKNIALSAIHNPNGISIPKFDYHQVLQNGERLLEALHDIMEDGAILVQNAPNNDSNPESTVSNLGKHIAGGQLSHGLLYGQVFHLQSMTDAHNIAYTLVALPPHQDVVYYESKPFLQLLHCGHTDPDLVISGELVLMDAMAAAKELQKVAPKLFDTLCNLPATFLKQQDGANMIW